MYTTQIHLKFVTYTILFIHGNKTLKPPKPCYMKQVNHSLSNNDNNINNNNYIIVISKKYEYLWSEK